jgi:lysophospholipase
VTCHEKTIFLGLQGWKPDVSAEKGLGNSRKRICCFLYGPLTNFWRQREEAGFTGVGNVPVRFVRFRAEKTIVSLWFALVA